jgi:quercetin dioxygenase-like cupin family protein
MTAWWKHVSDEVRFSPDTLTKSSLFESPRAFCDVYGLEPGQSQAAHSHADADKVYHVLEGEGLFYVGTDSRLLGPGAVVWCAAGTPHGVTNSGKGRLALLVFMAPHPRFRKV